MTVADNPLAAELERGPVPPTTLVIFGATGDLARRKLLPAVYALAHEGALPERFDLVGVARREMDDDAFRAQVGEAIESGSRMRAEPEVLRELLARISYVPGSFDEPATFCALRERLDALDERSSVRASPVFYLSTAPDAFPVIVGLIGQEGLAAREGASARVVVEKPFGRDGRSAGELNARVLDVFEEGRVFRIDHYLGKETVQNMLVLRFANGIFEPLWNRGYVDHVQITAAEDIGIGTRAGYYDAAGALRDIVQNHLLQLLTILAMEPPVSFSADDVRDEKVKALRALTHVGEDRLPAVVRGQYDSGVEGGRPAPGYLEEEGVPSDSRTETYVALRLEVDNWRWAGVPFYLRAGKRLARRTTEIAVALKPVPHLAFAGGGSLGVQPNQLVLSVQPNEGVSLSLVSKIPGAGMRVRPVSMEFLYGTSFLSQSPEAYERLLLDAMRGDATLFARGDEVEAAWAVCDPVLERFEADDGPLAVYPAGSSGPAEADALLEHGARWRAL